MAKLQQSDIDTWRQQKLAPQKLLINGRWQDAQGQRSMATHSPIDGAKLTDIALASKDDVDQGVKSARAAFQADSWARIPPSERKRILLNWADLIEKHQTEIAVLGVRDNGTEISMAHKAEPGSAIGTLRYYAEAIDKIYGQIAPTADRHLGMIVRQPVGVVGAIIPWNFPLMIGMWKVAPALSAGNSVLIKPPQIASLSWLKLGELACQAGIPDGVFNVLTGTGSETGQALALHPDVDVISFTGGGTVGRQLLKDSADSNLKRIYLELGGKSPHIIFSDSAHIDASIKVAVKAIFRNSGQVCIAGSRLLIQEDIIESYTEKLVQYSQALVVGDPLDLNTQVGAVCGETQLQHDLAMVAKASEDNNRLRCGGQRILLDSGGTYMAPTVFDQVKGSSRLAQEEVFGPVLAVIPFKDEKEAIALANQSIYGLSSGLWTSDLARAHRVAHSLQAGVVHINCYGQAPVSLCLGGVKQSGNGYDKSLHALDKFTNLKSIWLDLQPE